MWLLGQLPVQQKQLEGGHLVESGASSAPQSHRKSFVATEEYWLTEVALEHDRRRERRKLNPNWKQSQRYSEVPSQQSGASKAHSILVPILSPYPDLFRSSSSSFTCSAAHPSSLHLLTLTFPASLCPALPWTAQPQSCPLSQFLHCSSSEILQQISRQGDHRGVSPDALKVHRAHGATNLFIRS